ncbi:hypothetical protein MIR68_011836 [Amoeboaphelidium protococcarum]|nr:hypothetical protein MIR68_011836 [Amoeboaphelidium protococcarum]
MRRIRLQPLCRHFGQIRRIVRRGRDKYEVNHHRIIMNTWPVLESMQYDAGRIDIVNCMTSVMGLYYLNDAVEFVLPVVPQRNNEILRSIYFRLIKKYKLSKFTASLSISSVYGQCRQPMEQFSLTRLSDNSILASSNRYGNFQIS